MVRDLRRLWLLVLVEPWCTMRRYAWRLSTVEGKIKYLEGMCILLSI